MIILYQAWANIGHGELKGRYLGDVIKENGKTVVMIFYPPEDLKREYLAKGMTLRPVGPVKRHIKKHRVSRIK